MAMNDQIMLAKPPVKRSNYWNFSSSRFPMGGTSVAGIFLLSVAIPVAIFGQTFTSNYQFVSLAGNFLGDNDSGWNVNYRNMFLISNNTWQTELFIPATAANATNELKFKANGDWSTNWGENNQTNIIPAVGGTTELSGGNIKFRVLLDGYYRFTINTANRAYSIIEAPSTLYSNRVRNSSFEIQAFDEWHAYHWTPSYPDNLAETFGNSGRSNWRRNSGTWQSWIGSGTESWQTFGGIWQDVPAGRGYLYEIAGYFYADTNWTAANKELKIEYFKHDRSTQLGFQSITLSGLSNSFQRFSLTTGPAPNETAWARLVVFAQNTGTDGTLQFDDLSLVERPVKTQLFTDWPQAAMTTGTHRYGGWDIENGNVTDDTNLTLSALSAKIQPGGRVRSAEIAGGIGRITLTYRHGVNTDDEDSLEQLSILVRTSVQPTDFGIISMVLSNIVSQDYETLTININQPDHRYVHVEHFSGTNAFMIGSLAIGDAEEDAVTSSLRYQDFEQITGWETNGTYSTNDWDLSSGRTVTNGAFSGQSGVILGSETITNFLQTPFYTDGYGAVSFQYARGSVGNGPANLTLQESADGTNWITIAAMSNITASSYALFDQFYYKPQPRFLRIMNIPLPVSSEPPPAKLIEEPFTNGQNPPPGWEFRGIGEYTSDGSSGIGPKSLKFDSTGDYIISPNLSSPTGITFWIKGNSINAASTYKLEQTSDGNNWSQVFLLSNIGNTEQTRSYSLNPTSTKIKFTYENKVGGNIAFDDVIIYGSGEPGETNQPQEVLVDNITIGLPAGFRRQNFDTWPRKSSYTGISIHEGWQTENTIIDAQNAYRGQVARLNQNAGPYVKSHHFGDGIGYISFRYRAWDDNPAAQFVVEYSLNETDWNVITNVSTTATSYQDFYHDLSLSNGASIRIRKTAGERLLIDDIYVSELKPPANINIYDAGTIPDAPFTNDAVRLFLKAGPVNDAINIGGSVHYRIGGGSWTNAPLTQTGFQTYSMPEADAIPPQPVGTIVEFYFEVTFEGPGSSLSSPRIYPAAGASDPLRYSIARAATGQVWINEVNVSLYEGEFIELAGPANFNLSGWSLDFFVKSSSIYTNLPQLYQRIIFPIDSAISSASGAYGFFLIGDGSLSPEPNILFPGLLSLYWDGYPMGLQLVNESGGIEHKISIDGSLFSFPFAAVDGDDWDDFNEGVSLVGSGTNYADFSWLTYVTNTPGFVNIGQTLNSEPANMDPPMIMRMIVANNTVQVITIGNTNAWNATPYYTTNLMVAAPQWLSITPAQNTLAGGTNTIFFTAPAMTNAFYHIKFTP